MQLIKNIYQLFFPEICLNCQQVLTSPEKHICIFCKHELSLTNFTSQHHNKLEKTFYGRIEIQEATALLFYSKKGIVQKLIHQLKYFNQENLGVYFGNWLGTLMVKSNRFNNIDYIVPVPLHHKKLKKRGYNQVSKFGKHLAEKLNTTFIEHILIRKNTANTQSKKIRIDRWNNVNEMFYLTNLKIFTNKHILLIDDIITTGATIEACTFELFKSHNIKISIAVIAYTN